DRDESDADYRELTSIQNSANRAAALMQQLRLLGRPNREETEQSDPPGGTEAILVVDDDPAILDLLVKMLQGKGYRVVTADNGPATLEFIEATGDHLDLILSDDAMPGMNGRELAREIRLRRPDAKILLCKTVGLMQENETAAADYATDYVRKPYQPR